MTMVVGELLKPRAGIPIDQMPSQTSGDGAMEPLVKSFQAKREQAELREKRPGKALGGGRLGELFGSDLGTGHEGQPSGEGHGDE